MSQSFWQNFLIFLSISILLPFKESKRNIVGNVEDEKKPRRKKTVSRRTRFDEMAVEDREEKNGAEEARKNKREKRVWLG